MPLAHSGRAVVPRGVSYLRDLWPAHLTICNRAGAEEYTLGPLCPLCIRRFSWQRGSFELLPAYLPAYVKTRTLPAPTDLKPNLTSSRTAVSRGGSHLRDLWPVYLSASAKTSTSPCVDYNSSPFWLLRARLFPVAAHIYVTFGLSTCRPLPRRVHLLASTTPRAFPGPTAYGGFLCGPPRRPTPWGVHPLALTTPWPSLALPYIAVRVAHPVECAAVRAPALSATCNFRSARSRIWPTP